MVCGISLALHTMWDITSFAYYVGLALHTMWDITSFAYYVGYH